MDKYSDDDEILFGCKYELEGQLNLVLQEDEFKNKILTPFNSRVQKYRNQQNAKDKNSNEKKE